MKSIDVIDLGVTEYSACLDIQRDAFHERVERQRGDTLFLTQHNHVYTIGKSGDENHLLAGKDELRETGIQVVPTDRGGDITYHGPGQLVGYPILDLAGYYRDVHRYLRELEEVLIRTLDEFGVSGSREPGYTGVWTGGEKIAAIGIRTGSWVTMHGFALNVNTDLSFFDRIIPCGISHRGVTSLEKCTGRKTSVDEVAPAVVRHFSDVFGVSAREVDAVSFMHNRNSNFVNT